MTEITLASSLQLDKFYSVSCPVNTEKSYHVLPYLHQQTPLKDYNFIEFKDKISVEYWTENLP